ncbi:MAG TPA: Na-translocating system protein MpsC family protein [Solirubrobacterales bacterium]|nr:Na-translocating system protein MpsC family protein [Solirubrobacterales bacterium]
MSDAPKPPQPPLEEESGTSLRAALSREMVKAMKAYYGKGPTKAKSYLFDDLLFVVMRGGMTQGEETLLEAGFSDDVRTFRQRFENVMGDRLVGMVEQLTERKVLTYQSQVLFDPFIVIEIFVFDQPHATSAIEATARALLSKEEDDAGTVGSEDPATDPE